MRIYLEYVDDKSEKFWEAQTEGATLITRWGKIGADGQTKTEELDSAAAAEEAAEKQADAKRKKGYEDADAPAKDASDVADERAAEGKPAAPAKKPSKKPAAASPGPTIDAILARGGEGAGGAEATDEDRELWDEVLAVVGDELTDHLQTTLTRSSSVIPAMGVLMEIPSSLSGDLQQRYLEHRGDPGVIALQTAWLHEQLADLPHGEPEADDDAADDDEPTVDVDRTYLEFRDDKSEKFWEATVRDETLVTRWGKIGTNGQTKEEDFDSAEEATQAAGKQADAKRKKGYADADAPTVWERIVAKHGAEIMAEIERRRRLWVDDFDMAVEEMVDMPSDELELDDFLADAWEEADQEDEVTPWLTRVLEELDQRDVEQFEPWSNKVTDNDRLMAAFAQLTGSGIWAELDCGWDQTGGWIELYELHEDEGDPRGGTFAHEQDMDRMAPGKQCDLYLAFGALGDGAEVDDATKESLDLAIGREVVDVLEAHGLRVEWNGKQETRILVKILWQPHAPGQEPSAAAVKKAVSAKS